MSTTGNLLVLMVIVVLYVTPSLVAIHRAHRNAVAIFVLNALLGWTFIGWAIALVWAFTYDYGRAVITRLTDDEFEELKRCILRGNKA